MAALRFLKLKGGDPRMAKQVKKGTRRGGSKPSGGKSC